MLKSLISKGLTVPHRCENRYNLASQGIDREQAKTLRASLATFSEDWNSPEMSVYDNYDAAKANG
jgi:hypothetical protein